MELPDDLLIEAKATAAQRRTTLKALAEHALRRELQPQGDPLHGLDPQKYELNELGLPCLKSLGGNPLPKDYFQNLIDEDDRSQDQKSFR